MRDFSLVSKVGEYNTAYDQTNAPETVLVTGSQNVLIDGRNGKVKSRQGYSRLGAANSAMTPIRKGVTWNSSTGLELPVRNYAAILEVYLGTVDGTVIDAWTQVSAGVSSTAVLRFDTWFDSSEFLDVLIWVQGDTNIYEWGGGVAVVDSLTGTTVTKAGTSTFAQNRFYASRNRTFICVRTGTEYTYTGGAGTTTLTGITDTTGLVAGDILVQKIVTQSNKPASTRTNDTLFVFENQAFIGSFTDNNVYISKNSSYYDFAYSAPRLSGEGGLLTLDGPSGGINVVSNILVAFAGRDSIFRAEYEQIEVGSTLAETLKVKKLKTGINQSSQSPDCIIPYGNGLAYLTYEPALRELDQSALNDQPALRTLSNPIKPDFDAETWTNAQGFWFKNDILLTAPSSSRLYILEFVEDADGKLRRFWQPPQILPVRSLAVISDSLHGHSDAVAETYKLFDGYSDVNSNDDKIPINAIAKFAYRSWKQRALLKNHDEYYVEGEITPSTTDLLMDLNYDFGGNKQVVERTIDGSNQAILEETVGNASLGVSPLGQEPLGGLLSAPADARKFRVIFEMAREDYNELQTVFSTNDVDRYWSILAHGPNVVGSRRKDIAIKL